MDHAALLPPGELIKAGGSRFHVRQMGDPNAQPIILETGLTLMSSCWGWLAPELAKRRHVITYDRAGLGWSGDRDGLRDARQLADECLALAKELNLKKAPVLAGHSMGAIIAQAVHRLDSNFATAMVWLDPSHPDLLTRSRRMRSFLFLLEFAHLLAARNLPSVTLRITSQLSGLPAPEYRALNRFLKDPRHLRTCAREARAWRISADFVRNKDIGEVPLLVVSAQKHALRNWGDCQKDLVALSAQSKQVTLTDMSHLSMLADRFHAARVAAEIDGFLSRHKL